MMHPENVELLRILAGIDPEKAVKNGWHRHDIDDIAGRSVSELTATYGFAKKGAERVVAAFALAQRLAKDRAQVRVGVGQAGDVNRMLRPLAMALGAREGFWCVDLDVRNRVQNIRQVSIGTMSMTAVTPREVFGPAVAGRVCKMVIAHSHPSGDPSPSLDDRRVTERMKESGDLLGIEVLDHVVIGSGSYFSFADEVVRYNTEEGGA